MRHTRIHVTLGPSSSSEPALRALLAAGMDACRINMSHSSHEQARDLIRTVRGISSDLRRPIAVGADLKGPKLRLGDMRDGGSLLEAGSLFALSAETRVGDATGASVDYPYLVEDVSEGDQVLLADGTIVLRAEKTGADSIVCRVQKGGFLSSRKGVNLPGVALRTPSLTQKDMGDMAAVVEAGVDFLYVSYARSARHIQEIRDALQSLGSSLPVVAKVERQEGADALGEIAAAADGVCIARGDLGIEVAVGAVPALQEAAARLCRTQGTLSMMGGQVLSSMVSSPLPLRAEVADIATAVRDGIGGIILSDETSIGDYPVEAVSACARIIETAEATWRTASDLPFGAAVSDDWRVAGRLAASERFSAVVAITGEPSVSNWLAGWGGILPVPADGADPATLASGALQAAGADVPHGSRLHVFTRA